MKSDNLLRFGLAFLLVLFSLGFVDALAISPGSATLSYSPGSVQQTSFEIFNDVSEDMILEFVVEGELKDYVSLEGTVVSLASDENKKSVSMNVAMPQGLEPGEHLAEVWVRKKNVDIQRGVSAEGVLVFELRVDVAYPSDFVELNVDVFSVEKDSAATLSAVAINRGGNDIQDAKADIEIISPNNEQVAFFELGLTGIKSGERSEFSTKWDVDTDPGVYVAKLRFSYNGKVDVYEKEFSVGLKPVEIASIGTDEFVLGETARFRVNVANKAKDTAKAVSLMIEVIDSSGNKLGTIKSERVDISPESEKEIVAFWDTYGIGEGEYLGRGIIKRGDKVEEETFSIKVDAQKVEILQGSPAYTLQDKVKSFSKGLLLYLILGLLGIDVVWYVISRRRKKG